MVYVQSWDNAAPDGATTPAADIDAEIRNLKVAISERMDDLVGDTNWANDGVEPKTLINAIAGWHGLIPQQQITTVTPVYLTPSELYNAGPYTLAGSQLTVDVDGVFWVMATPTWGTAPLNAVVSQGIAVNGLTTAAIPSVSYGPSGVDIIRIESTLSGMLTLTSGDYIEVWVHHPNYLSAGFATLQASSLTVLKVE